MRLRKLERTQMNMTHWTILVAATACLASAGCKKKAPTSTVDARPPVSSKPAETEVAPPPSTAPRGDVTADVLKQASKVY